MRLRNLKCISSHGGRSSVSIFYHVKSNAEKVEKTKQYSCSWKWWLTVSRVISAVSNYEAIFIADFEECMFTLHSCSNFARTFKAIQATFSWLVENSFSRINCGVEPAKCSKLRISDGSGIWQFSMGFAWATTQLIWVWHCFILSSPLLFFFSGQFWWNTLLERDKLHFMMVIKSK